MSETNITGDNNEIENIAYSEDLMKILVRSITEKDKQLNRILTLLEKKDEAISDVMTKMDKKDAQIDELIGMLKTKLK